MRRALLAPGSLSGLAGLASLLGGLTGCSSTVAGDVDGDSVPALFSSFFVQQKHDAVNPTDGSLATLFSVAGSGISLFDGCNAATTRQEAFNTAFVDQTKALIDAGTDAKALKKANEAFVDAIVDYDTKNVPSDFWNVGISMSAFSKSDLPKASVDLDIENPDTKATVIGGVSVCRVDNLPEKKLDGDGNASLKIHQTCFAAKKGTVDVNEYTEDKTFKITADVDLIAADGPVDESRGSATITVSGGWCEGLENALDDLAKDEEDRAQPPG